MALLKRFSRISGVLLVLLLAAACTTVAVDPPEENPIPTATAQPETEPADDQSEPEAPPEDEATDGLLVLTIVPEESAASYSVGETFLNQDNSFVTAVGITQEVEGTVTIDLDNPSNSTISTLTIDISQLTSDEPRRDSRIREQWLESSRYPIATFEPAQIDGLPDTYTPGEEIAFQVTGNLTIREVTNTATFDVTARLDDNVLRGTASTTIFMTDFGFDPPDIANILFVENDPIITLDFVARP